MAGGVGMGKEIERVRMGKRESMRQNDRRRYSSSLLACYKCRLILGSDRESTASPGGPSIRTGNIRSKISLGSSTEYRPQGWRYSNLIILTRCGQPRNGEPGPLWSFWRWLPGRLGSRVDMSGKVLSHLDRYSCRGFPVSFHPWWSVRRKEASETGRQGDRRELPVNPPEGLELGLGGIGGGSQLLRR